MIEMLFFSLIIEIIMIFENSRKCLFEKCLIFISKWIGLREGECEYLIVSI